MSRIKILYTTILTASFFSISTFAADNTATKAKWGYIGNTNAAHWGQLDPSFTLCAKGKDQSPINIPNKVPNTKNTLTINYESAPMIILDTGHGTQLNFSNDQSDESITFDGKKYFLVQFHIHTPAENKLHDQAFPLEIHLVHQNANGQVVVIGVFAKNGKANPTLKKIIDNLPKESGKEQIIEGEQINPADLLPMKHNYYSFNGSLTTPPCAEDVQWIMMASAITASSAQISKLKKAAGGINARPIQTLNNRVVSYSAEK